MNIIFVGLCCLACFTQVLTRLSCQQNSNCKLPDCLCSSFSHLGNPKDYPQIVYFGFDDALTVAMAAHYRKLFPPYRRNPNKCPIGMSLYIQHNYTNYSLVKEFYDKGMEIGVHSVTHKNIDTRAKLLDEGRQQRLNLHRLGQVPLEEIIGWRSPNLKTAGDDQPDTLKELGYTYDISLTYARRNYGDEKAFPFTLDYGNPLPCMVTPCPKPGSPHKGFWEIPINSLIDYKNQYPCPYVDGCYNGPPSEEKSFEYLSKNFADYYEGNKEPFGFHMHAAWFETRHNLNAMNRFIRAILRLPDVYIVTAKQMLDWVRNPVPISKLNTLPSWRCSARISQDSLPPLKIEFPINEIQKPVNSLASRRNPASMRPLQVMTPKQPVWQRTTTSRPIYRRPTTTSPTTTTRRINWRRRPANPTYRTPFGPPKNAVPSNGVHGNTAQNTRDRTNRVRQQTIKPIPTTPSTIQVMQPMTMAPPRHPAKSQSPFAPPMTWQGSGIGLGTQRYYTRPIGNGNTVPGIDSSLVDECIQGSNCNLPSCFCRTTNTPLGLPLEDTPQLVYFAFDGPIDGRVYAEYARMFDRSRRNADGCPISATLFVAKRGNYMKYLQSLADRGFDVALRGDHRGAYLDSRTMQVDLDQELELLRQRMINTSFYGWRSPAAIPLADEQFQLIKSRNLKYDSSLVVRSDSEPSARTYPYTLDFGWKDSCYTSEGCPKNKYPGLWEVPIHTLRDHRGQYRCIYADGCMQNPTNEEDTFQFLLKNFNRHYYSNKSPFGINLRHLWFSHYIYIPNKVGLDRFINYIVNKHDVYVVNIKQMVDWMRNPTPLSQLQTYQPWICPTVNIL